MGPRTRRESKRPSVTDVLGQLESMGHHLEKTGPFGACQAILWDAQRRLLIPAHDPRIPGLASGR